MQMTLKFDQNLAFPSLYAPKYAEFALVDVLELRYLSISGEGPPEVLHIAAAIETLYSKA